MLQRKCCIVTGGIIIMLFLLVAATDNWAQEDAAPAAPPPVRKFEAFTLGTLGFTKNVTQDTDGFFWIGSDAGLVRWDGVVIQTFTPENSGLKEQWVYEVYADRDGILWIGTGNNGLTKYDKTTNTFTVYQHDPNDPTSISSNVIGRPSLFGDVTMQDRDGFVWVGTFNGLNKLDTTQGRFTRYVHNLGQTGSLINNEVNAILQDRDGVLWVGTAGGLCRMSKDTETFTCYSHDNNDPDSLSSNVVSAIAEDREGVLWIGTPEGLNRFDRDRESFVVYKNKPGDASSLASNVVSAIVADDDGYLWLTHFPDSRGVSVFDPRTETFANYQASADPSSLAINDSVNVYKDRLGIIWVLSQSGTLSKYDPKRYFFTSLQYDPADTKGLRYPGGSGMLEYPQGTIWLPTWGPDGLVSFNRETGSLTPHPLEGKSFSTGAWSRDGTYWISEANGMLDIFDLDSVTLTRSYNIGATGFLSDIKEDLRDPDILWINTTTDGLIKFNRKTGESVKYQNIPGDPTSLSNNQSWFPMLQDEATPDLLWIGTMNGLNLFNKKTGKVERVYLHDENDPNSIATSIAMIHKTAAGEYWVITAGSGLDKFDPRAETFTHYSKKNGRLPANSFFVCLEDNQGNLWLAPTDIEGLVRFSPTTGTYKVYGKDDGVDFGSPYPLAHFKASNGELWFSGAKGFTFFDPAQVQDNSYKPPVYVSALTQSGDPMKLPAAPEQLKQITLDWQKPFFEFEMAALNYTAPGNNRYKYILEGWDKQWFESGTYKKGRYSGLHGGTYTLKVMGSNNDGLWSDQIAELQVIVTTPFWNTLWFRGGLATLLIGGLIVGLVLRTRAAIARQRELERKVEERTYELKIAKEKAEIASRAKSDFLSSMSHELRTPLNGIMGYAQILGQDQSMTPVQKDGLEIIYQSGSHLLTLINDILDLAKVEAGKLELLPSDFHFPTFLSGVAGIIKMRAEQRNIAFVYDAPDDLPVGVHADEKRLRQVLLNLLGNAVKFTKEGTVTLRVSSIGNWQLPIANCQLRFEIIDTGVGLKPEDLTKLFKPFEQVGDAASKMEGTGLGLTITRRLVNVMGSDVHVESEYGKGSTFWFEVTLPVSQVETPLTGKRVNKRITGYQGARLRIVVADDKSTNRLVIVNLLEPLGFEVLTAEDGREALEKVRKYTPHLLLTDLVMPVMTGFETAEELRKDPQFEDFPIIALSASVFEQDKQKSIVAGCNAFVPKPVQAEQLLEAMGELLALEWTYAEEAAVSLEESLKDVAEEGVAVTPPPAEDVRVLYNLALDGDIEAITRYAEHLLQGEAAYHAFARRLIHLARGYQDQALVLFVKQYHVS